MRATRAWEPAQGARPRSQACALGRDRSRREPRAPARGPAAGARRGGGRGTVTRLATPAAVRRPHPAARTGAGRRHRAATRVQHHRAGDLPARRRPPGGRGGLCGGVCGAVWRRDAAGAVEHHDGAGVAPERSGLYAPAPAGGRRTADPRHAGQHDETVPWAGPPRWGVQHALTRYPRRTRATGTEEDG